ncbi:MAG: hypothetical protein IJ019_05560 [Alphaproteobacteria bacterium]|nr:hypothetical protein [Alphaproteobacteria bacterium]
MRKYFLLGAVALMISGTANATTDYAEVTAKATIEVANTMICDYLDYGNIVVKAHNPKSYVYNDGTFTEGVLSVPETEGFTISCVTTQQAMGNIENISFPSSVTLKGTTSDTPLTLTGLSAYDEGQMETWMFYFSDFTLEIPAGVKADTYTGSFTVSYTY